MILKQSRINTLTCLNNINQGTKIVLSLKNAVRFKESLFELGFTQNLENGEKVLPTAINPSTYRNAETFYISDKTLPKETYFQTLLWSRKEWAGRGQTREVTDFVNIPRQRYQRKEYKPYGIELSLKYDQSGNLIVLTEPIEYCERNTALLINTINIFLTVFKECEVLYKDLSDFKPKKVINLNWDILPKGKYPWNIIKRNLKPLVSNKSNTKKQIMFANCAYINEFEPDFVAYGKAGFRGYVILGFTKVNIYVLESVYSGNATYIFGQDWEKLSKLTKAEILSDNLQQDRIIHNSNWKKQISNYLKEIK